VAGGHLSLRKLAVFLLVGGGATALHYLIAALLWRAVGLAPPLASGLGFGLSALFNYAANARYTFQSTGAHTQNLPRFALVAGIGLALNSGVIWGLTHWGWNAVAAQLLATVLVLAWNFVLNAVWTFHNGGQGRGTD